MQIDRVSPIDWLGACVRQDKRLFRLTKERISTKITDLARGCLSYVQCGEKDVLWPGLYGAQVSWESNQFFLRKGRSRLTEKKRVKDSLGIPIGLRSSGVDWLNAWIQFLIYLPKFYLWVSLTEKVFAPFADFVEQYIWDQQEGRVVSLANSESLYQCLSSQKIPMTDFCLLYRSLFLSLFPDTVSEDCILFHPEWVWTEVEEGCFPKQLIVAMPEMSRQLRLKHVLYDLDIFIEKRTDNDKTRFLTYIRMHGKWYQCEEERVRLIPSSMLSVPLRRGVLFHYKQVIV